MRSNARSSPAPLCRASDVAGKSAEMAGGLAGVSDAVRQAGATAVIAKVMRNAITLAAGT